VHVHSFPCAVKTESHPCRHAAASPAPPGAKTSSRRRELFAVVRSKAVRVTINQTYPLRTAAQAHRDLEARKTTGSTVLLP